jgi:hypothetical protein
MAVLLLRRAGPLEERGLAGAVRPDETDLLAGIELKGGVDEEDLPPVRRWPGGDCTPPFT